QCRRLRRNLGAGRQRVVGRRRRPEHHHRLAASGIERPRTASVVRSAPMMRWLRRLVWLGVLVGGGVAGYRMWSQRQAQRVSAPEWPPLSPEPRGTAEPAKPAAAKPAAAKPAAAKPAAAKPAAPARWVPPVDGKCPEGYPFKANDNSGI